MTGGTSASASEEEGGGVALQAKIESGCKDGEKGSKGEEGKKRKSGGHQSGGRSKKAKKEEFIWDMIIDQLQGHLRAISPVKKKNKKGSPDAKPSEKADNAKVAIRSLLKGLSAMNDQDTRYPPDTYPKRTDLPCSRCHKSETSKGNEIFVCENPQCFRAYHQRCQEPYVPKSFLQEVLGGSFVCWACKTMDDCLEIIHHTLHTPIVHSWQQLFPEVEEGEKHKKKEDGGSLTPAKQQSGGSSAPEAKEGSKTTSSRASGGAVAMEVDNKEGGGAAAAIDSDNEESGGVAAGIDSDLGGSDLEEFTGVSGPRKLKASPPPSAPVDNTDKKKVATKSAVEKPRPVASSDKKGATSQPKKPAHQQPKAEQGATKKVNIDNKGKGKGKSITGETEWDIIYDKVKNVLIRTNHQRHLLQSYEEHYDPMNQSAASSSIPKGDLDKAYEKFTSAKKEIRQILENVSKMNADHALVKNVGQEGEVHHDDIICSLCQSDDASEGNDVILCDYPGCGRAYHQMCLDPPVLDLSDWDDDDPFYCWKCKTLSDCIDLVNEECNTAYEKWEEVFREVIESPKPKDVWNTDDEESDEDYDPDAEGDEEGGGDDEDEEEEAGGNKVAKKDQGDLKEETEEEEGEEDENENEESEDDNEDEEEEDEEEYLLGVDGDELGDLAADAADNRFQEEEAKEEGGTISQRMKRSLKRRQRDYCNQRMDQQRSEKMGTKGESKVVANMVPLGESEVQKGVARIAGEAIVAGLVTSYDKDRSMWMVMYEDDEDIEVNEVDLREGILLYELYKRCEREVQRGNDPGFGVSTYLKERLRELNQDRSSHAKVSGGGASSKSTVRSGGGGAKKGKEDAISRDNIVEGKRVRRQTAGSGDVSLDFSALRDLAPITFGFTLGTDPDEFGSEDEEYVPVKRARKKGAASKAKDDSEDDDEDNDDAGGEDGGESDDESSG